MSSPKNQPPGPRIITVEPGPWRRRKRLVLPVVLANVGDVVLLSAFVGMLVYSCWAFKSPPTTQGTHGGVRLRKGAEIPGATAPPPDAP